MRQIRLAIAAMLIGACAPIAQAVEVFGNGNSTASTDGGGVTFNANNGWAIPFTTGNATGGFLDLGGATVLTGENTSNVTFSALIYNDAGTLAGPTGAPIATGSLSLGPSSLAWNVVSFDSPITLSTNANYYFALEQLVPFTDFTWRDPVAAVETYSDLGSGSTYSITPGNATVWRFTSGNWTNDTTPVTSLPVGFRLFTPVPEPSSIALAGVAIAAGIGLSVRRRWRRSK